MNKWVEIWNNRKLSSENSAVIEGLMKANGYDTSFSNFGTTDWINYVLQQGKKLKVSPTDSIFEVGCGAGAFLYPFYQEGHKIAGIDYSTSLVQLALEAMPFANIKREEAINILVDNQFDVVVSSGVFLYFSDYDYAATVLKSMLQITKKSIGIFDVPDLSKKQEALATRKSLLGEEEYQKKYQGLEHLYYDKNWFREVLATESCEVIIEDQNLSNYTHTAYRFNVYIYLK